ncbi:hypothetical protein ACFL3C_04370 [Patescibacteria group bacterium]
MKKTCKQCHGEIPEKAKKCKHCGSKIPPSTKQMIITAIVIVIIVGYFVGQAGNKTSTNSNSYTSKSSTTVSIGDEAKLVSSGSGAILVAIDQEAFDDLLDISVANDEMGLAELMLADRVFSVPTGIKVKVIDTDWFSKEVRILEGAYVGESGWVPMEFVQK